MVLYCFMHVSIVPLLSSFWFLLLSRSFCYPINTFTIPSDTTSNNRRVSVPLFNLVNDNTDDQEVHRDEATDNSIMTTSTSGGVVTQLHKLLWSTLTILGNRRLVAVIGKLFPTYHRDTIFYFSPQEKLVALTIDDGLSRGGSSTSSVSEVLSLLSRYNAHATFFVCSDYCTVDEALKQATRKLVVEEGHELGHHMSRDISGYYSKLSKQDFQDEFTRVKQVLENLVNANDDDTNKDNERHCIRWFRAPQGVYTRAMQQTLNEWNTEHDYSSTSTIRHVLGDCYCDDWALACRDSKFVVQTTLKQVRKGSILITHMPEKNTDREPILGVLERILHELDNQGYRCVSLSEMWEACDSRHTSADR